MRRTLVTLIAALSATFALAAEGPRKVWTAAEVVAVSGGSPAERSAAEALTAEPAAAPAPAAKTKAKTKATTKAKATKKKAAAQKPKGKSRKSAAKNVRAKRTR